MPYETRRAKASASKPKRSKVRLSIRQRRYLQECKKRENVKTKVDELNTELTERREVPPPIFPPQNIFLPLVAPPSSPSRHDLPPPTSPHPPPPDRSLQDLKQNCGSLRAGVAAAHRTRPPPHLPKTGGRRRGARRAKETPQAWGRRRGRAASALSRPSVC